MAQRVRALVEGVDEFIGIDHHKKRCQVMVTPRAGQGGGQRRLPRLLATNCLRFRGLPEVAFCDLKVALRRDGAGVADPGAYDVERVLFGKFGLPRAS